MFLLPRRDYRIDDNWHVIGLCATGSRDIVVENAFVPDYCTHSYWEAFALTHSGAAANDASRAVEDPFIQYRLSKAAAEIERSAWAVDRLFGASGGHRIFLDNPIQRVWRDVHATRAPAGNNPKRASLIFGRSQFGQPPQDIRF